MTCITPVDIRHTENGKYYHLIADKIVQSLPVMLQRKKHYYEIIYQEDQPSHTAWVVSYSIIS